VAVAEEAVAEYVAACSQIARSEVGTDEISYYPALNRLIDRLGGEATPRITAIPNPAAREGDFPDVGCWEGASGVLVLPVEAKGVGKTVEQLLALDQTRRYAKTFGGGHVLLTNLREFVWAELVGDAIEERARVTLVAAADGFQARRPAVEAGAPEALLDLLRAAWSVRPAIADPEVVARLLAYHAQQLAHSLEATGNPADVLRTLTESLDEGLGLKLEEDFLVFTVVQTLVYGLFAAWLNSPDPTTFKWQEAAHEIEMSVIASLLHDVSNPTLVRRANLDTHMRAVARVLNWVDRAEFEVQFNSAAIEYFYEPFLTAFDPDLRAKLGVWYTPREIAEYQVARVDQDLKAEFGLASGIADDSVLVLDPACGTGTYLAAVIRHIYAFHLGNGESEETAARRALGAAHQRLIGFEILPGAFIVSYLNLHRLLAKDLGALGVDERRLRIYLTNSLIGWGVGDTVPPVPLPGLEDELRESLQVKADEPVLVIIGNPPYEGYSAAEREDEKALVRPWIEPLWPEWRIRKHRLGDLYVRFWRVGVRKIAELTGRGIVSFITNRKWLAGRSFPVMREDIVHNFQEVMIDDLFGDVRGTQAAGDGSVFTTRAGTGIMVGVAVVTAVRSQAPDAGEIARVKYRAVHGSGAEKRAALEARRAESIDDGYTHVPVSKATQWRFKTAERGDAPALDEYLDFYLSGVQPVRDEAVVDRDREVLAARMADYFDPNLAWDDLIARHKGFGVERARYDGPRVRTRLLAAGEKANRIFPFIYRPFERRFLYWELRFKLLNEARVELDPIHQLLGQRYIVQAVTARREGGARPVVTAAVPAFAVVDPDGRAFPRIKVIPRDDGQLDLDPDPHRGPETNVQQVWLDATRRAGIDGDDLAVGDVVFYSLIAIMYSSDWVTSIPDDISDFPPVPLPNDAELLREAAALGHKIADLADTEATVEGVTTGSIREELRGVAVVHQTGDRDVTIGNRARGVGGRWEESNEGEVFWGEGGSWRHVPEALWRYKVGGYSVLSKWLSYRAGETLTPAELDEFTNICRRLTALIALEGDCNRLHEASVANRLEAARLDDTRPLDETPTA
jgi:hypothetical protein